MEWSYKDVRHNAWFTTFHRGWGAWLKLVAVCFIFAFVGSTNSSQTSFIDGIDRLIGSGTPLQPQNAKVLISYLSRLPILSELLVAHPDLGQHIINSITEHTSWLVHIFALNPRYFADNPNEVAVVVAIVAVISSLLRFCVLNVIALGQYRFIMESRFSRDVAWRRMLAPFHLHTLLNMIRVMVCYHAALLLWWLTIVGGIYKSLQYRMVPYLLAENPEIGWREARRLSMRMTDGYKWKMLVTQLSFIYIALLRAIPIIGLAVEVPLFEALQTEFYFTLRSNPALADDPLAARVFVERAFDGEPYACLEPDQQVAIDASQPVYLLKDLDVKSRRVQRGPLPYSVIDLIYMFFVFCFIGWVWEVSLHLFQAHEFVNRGTLYGPWIPIYGFGGAGIIVLLDRYRESPTRLFVMTVGLCAILEYLTSFVLDFMFNSSYWDYSDMMFNVNGRICLAGLLAFGFGGLLAIYVAAPAISRGVGKLPPRVRNAGAMALTLTFLADFAYCMVNGFNSGAGVGEDL